MQNGWIGDPLPEIPKGSQCPAVWLGLNVYKDALKCTLCNQCSKALKTMQNHFSSCHKGSTASKFCVSATVQTLTEAPSFIHFFNVEVDDSKSDPSINDIKSIPDTTPDELNNEYIANVGHLLVGIVTGNPGVFLGNLHPYPLKPVPTATGAGFNGYGYQFYEIRGSQIHSGSWYN